MNRWQMRVGLPTDVQRVVALLLAHLHPKHLTGPMVAKASGRSANVYPPSKSRWWSLKRSHLLASGAIHTMGLGRGRSVSAAREGRHHR
jgi:hypothetical protein